MVKALIIAAAVATLPLAVAAQESAHVMLQCGITKKLYNGVVVEMRAAAQIGGYDFLQERNMSKTQLDIITRMREDLSCSPGMQDCVSEVALQGNCLNFVSQVDDFESLRRSFLEMQQQAQVVADAG